MCRPVMTWPGGIAQSAPDYPPLCNYTRHANSGWTFCCPKNPAAVTTVLPPCHHNYYKQLEGMLLNLIVQVLLAGLAVVGGTVISLKLQVLRPLGRAVKIMEDTSIKVATAGGDAQVGRKFHIGRGCDGGVGSNAGEKIKTFRPRQHFSIGRRCPGCCQLGNVIGRTPQPGTTAPRAHM